MQRNSSAQAPGPTRPSHRLSGDYRNRSSAGANSETAVGAAQGPAHFPNGKPRPNGMMAASHQFDVARSPPSAANKNTKHVPCKFFKQGACQAGQACPFLHSTDAAVETAPCKYFTKGNCKFGAKCALAHILPDGRRVNRPSGPAGMTMNGGALNIGGRVNPPTYHQDSVLANSLLTQQQYPPADTLAGGYQYPQDDAYYAQDYDGRFVPAIAEPAPGSQYGSPGNETQFQMSGVERHLTALDAPLPASFDSNGISHIARYGAVAASVPSKFGMESPPASLGHRTTGQPLDPAKAFQSRGTPSNLRNSSQLGSSPPAINAESPSGQRKMHSQQSLPRPHLLSTSVPRPITTDDWDDGFPLEEDFLPPNLHDDVLTPQEKMRRLSRPEHDFGGPKSGPQSGIQSGGGGGGGGGLGIPSANSSKVGSPLGSSPSRFSALFAKQRQESSGNAAGSSGGGGLGHVGSPLRESHIRQAGDSPFGDGIAARPSPTSRSRSGQAAAEQVTPLTPGLTPRDTQSMGMSLISPQLQRTHLTTSRSPEAPDAHLPLPKSSSRLQPPGSLSSTGMRNFSAPVGSASGGSGTSIFDRTISSPRMNSARIAEEREGEGDLVFSMDDDTSKRGSGIFAASRSPIIAPLSETRNESRDAIVGGKHAANGIHANAANVTAAAGAEGTGLESLYSSGRS